MKKQIFDLSNFELKRGIFQEQTDEGYIFICPEDGLELQSSNKAGQPVEGINWMGMQYLVVELETLEDHSLTFNFDLYRQEEQNEYDMRVTFSILPHVMVAVPINLQMLDSQTLFAPRTEGRLRMMVYGKPIGIDEISCIKFTTLKCYKPQKICIKSIYLTDTEPVYNLPVKKMIDELGQWIPKKWEGKIKDLQKCSGILRELLKEAENFEYKYSNPDWDIYGG